MRLTVTDALTPEVFYFCHIHGSMGGRISVCDLNEDNSECVGRRTVTANGDGYITDTPVFQQLAYVPEVFDQSCGSANLAK